MARLDPSPSSETQDAASPVSTTRPRDQPGRSTLIARHLAAAFPDRLDQAGAAALTGAFIGAITAALQVLLDDADDPDDPATVRAALRTAADVALTPWLTSR